MKENQGNVRDRKTPALTRERLGEIARTSRLSGDESLRNLRALKGFENAKSWESLVEKREKLMSSINWRTRGAGIR